MFWITARDHCHCVPTNSDSSVDAPARANAKEIYECELARSVEFQLLFFPMQQQQLCEFFFSLRIFRSVSRLALFQQTPFEIPTGRPLLLLPKKLTEESSEAFLRCHYFVVSRQAQSIIRFLRCVSEQGRR
jgi:hypothetical protein